MYDTIIVGAGPAGLTCALYLLRANKKVLVLEAKSYGGQIVTASKVENYPGIPSISGVDFADNLYKQVKDLGVELKFETVLKIEEDRTVITAKNKYQGKTVVIATGAENRKLSIDNEELFVGKGVSYCASCDGALFKNKNVAVIGGGNTALQDALYLSDIAKKVYIVHRRDEFRGEKRSVSKLKEKENVEFVMNANVESLNGKEKLESITVKDLEGKETEIKVAGAFIAIGQAPRNELFMNVVDLNERGYIESVDGVHTKTDKIYVAGDTRVKELRQLTTAVSDGSIAAVTAIREMSED